jgi:hypothetical protein
LEELFNASAEDILTAIQHGFRAQVDVKGKLAEYFLHQQFVVLMERGVITDVVWQDKDAEPDFLIRVGERTLRVECKKTRNSKDGSPTRGYRVDEFDILAACLFNKTRRWEYLHIATRHLSGRPNMLDSLVVMQRVPLRAQEFWRANIEEAIHDAPAAEA